MPPTLAAFLAVAATFLVLDGLWLGLVARTFYRDAIGSMMVDKIRIAPAAAFYLLYSLAVVLLAVLPESRFGGLPANWRGALVMGAILGLAAYGTYDLTNRAVLKDWPLSVTIVDMAWGTFMTALAAAAGRLAYDAMIS